MEVKKARPDISDLAGEIFFSVAGKRKDRSRKKDFDSGLCLVDILLCDAFTLVRVPPDGSRIIQKRHAATALFRPSRHEKSPEFRAFFVLGSFVPVEMAGAEGLEPSARGFGVDVETNHGKQGKAGVARFSRTSPKRVVLVWCYGEIFRAKTGKKEREIPGKTGNALTKIDTGRIIKNAGQTTLG